MIEYQDIIVHAYVPSPEEKNVLPNVLADSETKIDDYFWPGWDGYPIEEAKADFRAYTGEELPVNPVEIVPMLIKLVTGECAGGTCAIKSFVQAQPTMNHLNGVIDIINGRMSELRRSMNRSGEKQSDLIKIERLNSELEQVHGVYSVILKTRQRLLKNLDDKNL